MTKEPEAGKKPDKQKKGKGLDLSKDVQAFASQLGLASGSGGSNAFDDFAPDKAKQRVNKDAPKPSGPKPQAPAADKQQGNHNNKRGRDQRDGSQGQGHQHGKPGGRQAAQHSTAGGWSAADKQAKDKDTKGRDWNFGVGPRPGESCLLG